LPPYQGDYTDTDTSLGLQLKDFSTAEDPSLVPAVFTNEQNAPMSLTGTDYNSIPKRNNSVARLQSPSVSNVPQMPYFEAPSLDTLAEGHSADFVGCPFPIVDENRQRRLLFASKGEDPTYSTEMDALLDPGGLLQSFWPSQENGSAPLSLPENFSFEDPIIETQDFESCG
jgi:hypothetical protein